jgi:hypothetical protein
MKTKESMVSDLENKMDDEMSKAGVYSKGVEGMMAVNDFKNSLGEESEIDEKWSKKYKDSIDCKNPKGFSQKAHCQGKIKKTETDESTGSGSSGGFSSPLFSTTKKNMEEGKEKDKEKEKKYLDIVDIIPELRKQLNKGSRLDKDTKKVEATEATGSGSSGQYSTTSVWAKSTNKKDWAGRKKTQIPGGKFVQVKEKCKKFPYCNQGDIKALKIFENEKVKQAIQNISKRHNISENVIKTINSNNTEFILKTLNIKEDDNLLEEW